MSKDIIIIGASGHGKVIADIVEEAGDRVYGFLDDNKEGIFLDKNILGKIEDCKQYREYSFIIAIGNNFVRQRIADDYPGLDYYTAIHPKASISKRCEIGKGSCVMEYAVIHADAKVGNHCIINTGSIVEHDDVLEDYVHISPNAALGGTVIVGKESHIGIGAVVKNNIRICQRTIIGAGGVVVKDITESGTYIGMPARIK